jgi:branched-chain amino acid transport system ATP-binding protein
VPISAAEKPLLELGGLRAGYGKIAVLHGVDLVIGAGEIVALLGPNGAGKTTLLRAVSGLLPWQGAARFGGASLAGLGPRRIAMAGLAHVIEGHRVFTQLTVADNLALAGRVYALSRGRIVLEAATTEPDLPERLERAYFGQHVATPLHG